MEYSKINSTTEKTAQFINLNLGFFFYFSSDAGTTFHSIINSITEMFCPLIACTEFGMLFSDTKVKLPSYMIKCFKGLDGIIVNAG